MTDIPEQPTLRVPAMLERLSALAWRFVVIAVAAFVVSLIVVQLRLIVIPLVVGLMLAAALQRPARWLMDRGWPPLASTWAVILGTIAILAGLGYFVVSNLAANLDDVANAMAEAYDRVKSWLVDGPFGLAPGSVERLEQDVTSSFGSGSGLMSGVRTVGEAAAGVVLAIIAAFFYVKDRDRMIGAVVNVTPASWRTRVEAAFDAGGSTLGRYLVGVLVVGLVDATIIGIGLLLIGVPLVIPLSILTFLAAFLPIVGAVIAGGVAALVALATLGPGEALLVVALTTVVQQIDGDVVSPLVYSRAVRLHPLAILVSLTTGAVIAGVMGAVLAVPILAVTTAVWRAWDELPDEVETA